VDDAVLVGRSLSHFRIVERIGAGGMGVVYRARDEHLQRDVAVKVLPPGTFGDEAARRRFRTEALALAKLRHPNIATIFDFDTQDGTDFLVMEFVPGTNLSDRLAAGPLPEPEVARLGVQLAEGLAAAHAQAVVHRDLKPGNLMTGPDGRLTILDFGLAKLMQPESTTATTRTVNETMGVAGTLPYMAPEQLRGETVDARTDIHAAGAVLYEMCSGRRPFRGKTSPSLTDAILHDAPEPPRTVTPGISSRMEAAILRCLEKDPAKRYQSAKELGTALEDCLKALAPREGSESRVKSLMRTIRRPRVAVPVALGLAVLAAGIFWFVRRQANIRWAREVALPEIARLVEGNDAWRNLSRPYALAVRAEKYIPDDPQLAELFGKCALRLNITTVPPGARVFVKEYQLPNGEWKDLGVTPIEKVRLPIGIFRWKFEKDGYETVLAAASTWAVVGGKSVLGPNNLARVLEKSGVAPAGMVRVTGGETEVGTLPDFYIDRHEVTNREYQAFVNAGGYKERKYWTERILRGGRELAWDKAVGEFKDQTGLPGPQTWQAGSYPEGQADFPVSGISWYEAAAYATFVGKSLPTRFHWGLAMGENTPMIQVPQLGGFAAFAPLSNFNRQGPVPVETLPGITSCGAFDMAGNVREWCWNETPAGRLVRGGAWSDNTYMFTNLSQAPSMGRSSETGFRLVRYLEPAKIPKAAFQATTIPELKGLAEPPVPPAVFEAYKDEYSYDKADLNARPESPPRRTEEWIHETISFDAAYPGERVLAHLFLPTVGRPPYQTIVYWPGSASGVEPSSKDLEHYYEFPMFLSFFLKNGRAVLYPVYKGTFERNANPVGTNQYAELFIQQVKDFRRCIDYLETRPAEIDSHKIGYYGMSWGAENGAIVPAIESRLKASVLLGGGLNGLGRADTNDINFVTHVTIPTLMLNGKYDLLIHPDTQTQRMFDMLGARDKKLIRYDTDHIPPRNEFVKESIAWFDRYLGPVR
jgi:eukaryotic-like serine/threonine-protein kinase